MRFLFTCGGTAGHINPALAVASALLDRIPGSEVMFIGAEGKMEMELVPREGYEIRSIPITNISRAHSLAGIRHNLDTVKNVLRSTSEARRMIRDFRPDVVIGTGGYVCFPVLTAAHELHIPTVIHESNAQPGLTTKLLSRNVDRILVGMENCRSAYDNPDRVEVTGTPVRDGFARYTRQRAREELGIANDEKVVLSVWGSLGAEHMNAVMLELIPLLTEKNFRLIHVTGKRYYPEFSERLREAAPDYSRHGVEVLEYLHDMPRVMAASDLMICRAGASTLSELAYIGMPSILVPSPNVVANHQEKNARVVEEAGGARVLLEGEFTARTLLDEIRAILQDEQSLHTMSERARSLAYADATERICEAILSLT
jgi:UDP-N-acetylglucosamine--N-acetylmuramyl-(pentapeptide) pyrophosphoryl-undecaprenol N-acetylglucosamine transferase